MRFTIVRDTLILALARAQGFVSKTDVAPATRCVRLTTVAGGKLKVDATDTENSLTASYVVTVEQDGATMVEAAPLHEMAKALPNGDVFVVFNSKQHRLELRPAGSSKAMFSLNTLDPDDFPPSDLSEYRSRMTIEGRDLARMIEEVAFNASKDGNRYGLNGAHFEIVTHGSTASERAENQKLRMVATDGSRLGWSQAPAKGKLTLMKNALMPAKGLGELARILGDQTWTMESEDTARAVRFVAEDVTVTLRFIEGEFPDYRQVVPDLSACPILASMNRSDLSMCVRRADMVAQLDRNHAATVSIDNEEMSLRAENIDRGDCTADLPAEIKRFNRKDGHKLSTGVNLLFLREIIAATNNARTYRWYFGHGELDPMALTPDDRDDALFIVMPMRVG